MAMAQILSWLRLDNVGKIFPSTSSKRDTGVFRLTCELDELVQPEQLQEALDKTLEQFPHFLYIMRSGFFWYYLEASELRPTVHVENKGVCAPLFHRNRHTLLFDVSYYENRIHLEVYHALADGTGAMQFYTCLLCRYIAAVDGGVDGTLADQIAPSPITARAEDGFRKYYRRVKNRHVEPSFRAYHFAGTKSEDLIITEGRMPCHEVLSLAKAHGTTLTVFLCALLLFAVYEDMQRFHQKRPVVLTVPVNLRSYFPSDTARNFFGNIRIAYRFGDETPTFEEVIHALDDAFKRELTEERLNERISRFTALERNPIAKAAPLLLKNFVLRIARRISDAGETMVVSNVGIVKLPEAVLQHVKHMSVFTGTSRQQICICTCGDVLSIAFSSKFVNQEIQCRLFRRLAELGVAVEISSNLPN
ncbi:MAG: hypothetical protein HFE78_01385 [Clostridiales bacterium]|nr:hypothetical protein [Clostridiales bacterium]